jgi:hypothetical protein
MRNAEHRRGKLVERIKGIGGVKVGNLNVRLARVSVASASECTRGDPLVLIMTLQGIEDRGKGRDF